VIRRPEELPGLNELSRWLLVSLRAEHARQLGEPWTSDEVEIASHDGRRAGYPFGLYYQATARQPGRCPDDAIERFRLASRCFSRDLPDEDCLNIRHFLADCMRLGEAAWGGDGRLWDEAREALARRLRPCPGSGLHGYYAAVFGALGASPDRASADAFLCRVPFF
jgi:hypothetical protein